MKLGRSNVSRHFKPGDLVMQDRYPDVHLRQRAGPESATVGPIAKRHVMLVVQAMKHSYVINDVFVITSTCQGWIDADLLKRIDER